MTESPGPIDVLTHIAAATLFHRTTDGIRIAAARGAVQTAAILAFNNHPIRLISLRSAEAYWARPPGYELELAAMQDVALELTEGGERYRLLHPWAIHWPQPACPHGSNWRCSKPPCSPTWFRDRGEFDG